MGTCSPPRTRCPWRLPLVPTGWGSSLCRRLLIAPCSRRRLLSWLSSLRLRVFGSFWISPLYFPDCGFAYMATCAALPHVSRLSFVLGYILVRLRPLPDVSLCVLWLPARLLWPSLRLRVCESSSLSLWFLPFRGPTPVSCLFLRLRPCRSRSPIPSLAPSRWGPCTLRRWA